MTCDLSESDRLVRAMERAVYAGEIIYSSIGKIAFQCGRHATALSLTILDSVCLVKIDDENEKIRDIEEQESVNVICPLSGESRLWVRFRFRPIRFVMIGAINLTKTVEKFPC